MQGAGAALLLLAACGLALSSSAAAAGQVESPPSADTPPQLPPDVLFQLLYAEPNNFLQSLGNISDTEGSLTRTFLSPAHRRAAGKLRRWMASAGMRTWADQMANVHGVVKGADPTAPAIFIGSHYDTVVDGGKYDGALGIVVGIAAVKALLIEAAVAEGVVSLAEVERVVAHARTTGADIDVSELLYDQGQASQLFATPVRVIAFADEEGVRFHSTYLGSRALVGTLADVGVLRNIDHSGVSVAEALEQAGFDPSPAALRKMAIPRDKIKAYVEVHMEQGPRLQAAGRPLGPVAAIAGQSRLQAEIIGEQGHAGTVPMKLRKDPMAAAAEIIAHMETMCNGGAHEGPPASPSLAADESLVCTVGSMDVWPNAGNVIPGNLNFTLDIRSQWDANRKQVITSVEERMKTVCERRGMSCRLILKNTADAVHSDEGVVQSLMDAAVEAEPVVQRLFAQRPAFEHYPGSPTKTCAASSDPDCKPPVLVSGAGHDAMVLAEVTKMGMLFVRCRDGISHSPLEFVSPDDVAASTATLYQYLRKELLAKLPAAEAPAAEVPSPMNTELQP
ncbi:Allantoate deiminase [Micractinium conductrix]|uniref:Allantoate deiminase n=1 Tax=Micractinium conductrix TaxID=554055 RepID=A0A2P6UZV2_9CHLO|nr:Allantoate deiminase [Micractinium conductrix]|eukprot:PSC67377.1 Allantoate deiminase [Micractinium conductrix]